MEFRHLRYFLALSEELHFGRAAERLSISQPPLSINIRQLEESIGARLFERSSKAVKLTPAGRAFVPAARSLLRQAFEAGQHAQEVEQGISGRLRVGFVGSMLYRGLPKLLRKFQSTSPKLRLISHELSSQDQVTALAHGQIDVGFVHTMRVPQEIDRLLFSSEPFVCCLPTSHKLAKVRRLAPQRLAREPFVMFSRGVSPDYYERVLSTCTDAGFYPEICHEVRHWLSVVSFVAQGMGVGIVPAALKRSGFAGTSFVPLEGAKVQSQVFCIWRRSDDQPAVQSFVNAVRGDSAVIV